MSEPLKPCPFCGGEATFNEDPYPECEGFWINCTRCKASTGTHYDHVDDMVSAWNLRNPIAVIEPFPPALIVTAVNAMEPMKAAIADAMNYIAALPTQNQKDFEKIDATLHAALRLAEGEKE